MLLVACMTVEWTLSAQLSRGVPVFGMRIDAPIPAIRKAAGLGSVG